MKNYIQLAKMLYLNGAFGILLCSMAYYLYLMPDRMGSQNGLHVLATFLGLSIASTTLWCIHIGVEANKAGKKKGLRDYRRKDIAHSTWQSIAAVGSGIILTTTYVPYMLSYNLYGGAWVMAGCTPLLMVAGVIALSGSKALLAYIPIEHK